MGERGLIKVISDLKHSGILCTLHRNFQRPSFCSAFIIKLVRADKKQRLVTMFLAISNMYVYLN